MVSATEVRDALASLPALRPRAVDDEVTVMGAGTDDLVAGRRYLAALAPGGWAVPTWPPAAGGRGADTAEAATVAMELARYWAPDLYPFGVGLSLVGPTLLAHGTSDQQARWLPSIRSGEEIWCQLFSEPDAGSDLASLSCRAIADGDDWRVTGSKVWSSRAHYAQWGLLLARTDPEAAKHAGITAFGLRMDRPGVEVRPLKQMNGDTHFNQVFLTDVVVDDADRIGAAGSGWAAARTTLLNERGAIGGGSPFSFDRLFGLAAGAGAAGDPIVRQRLADLHAAAAVARWARRRGVHGSLSKLALSGTLKGAGELGVDLLGPAGVTSDGEWPTLFVSGPSFSIRGGTDEIQRNIVAERILGLPRDLP